GERPMPYYTGSGAAALDPELAVAMDFKGFRKNACTFDLEAMFQQTGRTIVGRTWKTLGKPVFPRLGQRWLPEQYTPLTDDPDSMEN
uniref:Uncharacterized protein n=1 Tax=Spermophilus dauricus TaxID=99837 RepID=A0A8C9QDH9_SPEDA